MALLSHVDKTGHKLCNCIGYKYEHRPGSKLCDSNPYSGAWRASKHGATDEEFKEIWSRIEDSLRCPF